MNREKEFLQRYYDWIVKCLQADNKLESLAFFRLGCDLGIRQKELSSITWSQIEFPYISNVQILKSLGNSMSCYLPLKFSKDTATAIHTGCTDTCEKLFSKQPFYYVAQIQESCGDKRFNGHDMRRMAIILNLTGRYDALLKGTGLE